MFIQRGQGHLGFVEHCSVSCLEDRVRVRLLGCGALQTPWHDVHMSLEEAADLIAALAGAVSQLLAERDEGDEG